MAEPQSAEEKKAVLKWAKMRRPSVGFSADSKGKSPLEGQPDLNDLEETVDADTRLGIGELAAEAEEDFFLDKDISGGDLEHQSALREKRKRERNN